MRLIVLAWRLAGIGLLATEPGGGRQSTSIAVSCEDVSAIGGLDSEFAFLQLAPPAARRLEAARSAGAGHVELLFEGVGVPKDPAAHHDYGSNDPGSIALREPGPALRARLRSCVDRAPQRVAGASARCESGSAEACGWLGLAYQVGFGVRRDVRRELELHRKACDGGYLSSCNHLAMLYFAGSGVEADRRRAFEMWKKTCAMGDDDGCVRLATVGLTDDPAEANALLQRSCDRRHAPSCAELGERYVNGFNALEDLERGRALLDKACRAGFEDACVRLEKLGKRR